MKSWKKALLIVSGVFPLLILQLLFARDLLAQSATSLIQPSQSQGGWRFDNGQEFPGAKGPLFLSESEFRGQPVLTLHADFSGGGNYVQAAVNLPDRPLETLSFSVKVPVGQGYIPIRLVDGSKQCHQVKLKLNFKGGWQQITVPVETFF